MPTVAYWFTNNRGESKRNADIYFQGSYGYANIKELSRQYTYLIFRYCVTKYLQFVHIQTLNSKCFTQEIKDLKTENDHSSACEEWSHYASELWNKSLSEQIKFEDYFAKIRKYIFFGLCGGNFSP